MTKYDCYEMGRQAYYNDDYDYAEQWMMESMTKFDNNTDGLQYRNISEDDIVEYYTLSLFKQGESRLNNK